MKVTCPDCSVAFRVPDGILVSRPVKLHCSECGSIFRARLLEGQIEVFHEKEESSLGEEPSFLEEFSLFESDAADEEFVGNKPDLFHSSAVAKNQTMVGLPNASVEKAIRDAQQNAGLADESTGPEEDELDADSETHVSPPIVAADATGSRKRSTTAVGRGSKKEAKGGGGKPDAKAEDRKEGSPAGRRSRSDLGSTQRFIGMIPPEEKEKLERAKMARTMQFEIDPDAFGDAFGEKPEAKAPAEVVPSFVEPTSYATGQMKKVEVPDASLKLSGKASEAGFSESGDRSVISTGEFFINRGQSSYGSPDDMVDPSFGMGVEQFDPGDGQVDSEDGAPPEPASAANKTARKHSSTEPSDRSAPIRLDRTPVNSNAQSSQGTGPRASVPSSARTRKSSPRYDTRRELKRVDERGAGSGGVWVTLLSLIAVFLFLLGVAAKNDWHLDLKNFGHMLEVAIQDEAYVPRPEWQKGSTVSEVEGVAVSAENVVAHWIKRDKAGPLILIKATVVNHQDSPIARVQVSTEILDGGGDVIYKSEQRVEPKIGPKRLSQTGARDALAPLIRRVPISLGTKGRKRVHLLVDAKQAGVASEGDLSYRVQVAKGKIP